MSLLLLTLNKEKIISKYSTYKWTLNILQDLQTQSRRFYCTFNVGYKAMTVTTELHSYRYCKHKCTRGRTAQNNETQEGGQNPNNYCFVRTLWNWRLLVSVNNTGS
jgi:hypothetical protein